MADVKDLPHHERPVFAAAAAPDGSIVLTVGITETAWKYLHDAKTLNVDLRKAGVPVTLILFGEKTQATCKATLEEWNRKAGRPGLDMTGDKERYALNEGGQRLSDLKNNVFKR